MAMRIASPTRDARLQALLAECPQLWRGRPLGRPSRGIPTGHAVLDEALPDRGWPPGGMLEVLHDGEGAGQVSLFLPAAARLAADGAGVLLIAPPRPPCGTALLAAGLRLDRCAVLQPQGAAEALWAAEQAARSSACGMVLLWASPAPTAARRLQLAASEGGTLLVCFSGRRARAGLRPVLRLQVVTTADGMRRIRILKARGACRQTDLLLPPVAACS